MAISRPCSGIDLDVQAGEVFAFLGPNGAGKTTTVEILEGYRKRSGGEVEVLGSRSRSTATGAWRERIGIVLQSCRLDPYLTVRESLGLYAGYYSSAAAGRRGDRAGRAGGKADARAGKLSGGQQRRLDVGMALVGDPELLFLDEPTTGFDPSARRQAWETIAGLRDLGKTVFLTTHYMDEAQRARRPGRDHRRAARSSPRAPRRTSATARAADDDQLRLPRRRRRRARGDRRSTHDAHRGRRSAPS